MIAAYLPWLLSALTIWMTVLAGNKHRSAWLIGLANQALWLVWIIATEAWGLLPMNLALWAVYARNHWRWSADREKGSVVPSDKPVTPKYTVTMPGVPRFQRVGLLVASQSSRFASRPKASIPNVEDLKWDTH